MHSKVTGYLVLAAGIIQFVLLISTYIVARRMNMLYAELGTAPIHLSIYYAVLTAMGCADVLIARKLIRRSGHFFLNTVAVAAIVVSVALSVKMISLIMSALVSPVYNMG